MAFLGWIGLTIFLIILALLFILFISPIRYKVYFASEDGTQACLSIRWLYRLFSLTITYEEGQELTKELYILGRMHVGKIRDYDEWLEKRVAKELDEVNCKDDPVNEESVDSKDASNIEKVSFNRDGSMAHISYQDSHTDNQDGNYKEIEALDNKEPIHTIENKPADPLDVKPNYFWWKPYMLSRAFWYQMGHFMSRCYQHSSPRKTFIKGRFGLANPYYMGIVAGILYTTWPQAMKDVNLDFVETVAKGQVQIEGRVIIGVLAWYGLCLVLSQPIRSCIGSGLTFLWQKRKYDKKHLSINDCNA